MKYRFRQPTMIGPVATLEYGPYVLNVAPEFGGRIVSFRYDGRDVLRSTPAAVLLAPKVYEFAGFPLMPYSGPLFGPGFAFAGLNHTLNRTVREEPTATHGDAWISSFCTTHQDKSELMLQYDYVPETGNFPFRWRGNLHYTVGKKGLSIFLRVTSRDHRLMPAGIGFHPYFPKNKGSMLHFDAVGVWPADAPEAVSEGCQPLRDDLSFCEGRDVSDVVIDRLYEGWDGRAELTASDGFRTLIEADGALDKLQLYSAWDYPYVCIEPVSNTNDGFNRMAAGVPSHGVRVLEPNRSIEGAIRIFVDTDTIGIGENLKRV